MISWEVWTQRLPEDLFSLGHTDQLNLRPCQSWPRGQEIETLNWAGDDGGSGWDTPDQHFIDSRLFRPRVCSNSRCCITLWVHVHQENTIAHPGQGGGEIDRGGRLPHAALLVCNGYELSQVTLLIMNQWIRPFLVRESYCYPGKLAVTTSSVNHVSRETVLPWPREGCFT